MYTQVFIVIKMKIKKVYINMCDTGIIMIIYYSVKFLLYIIVG